MNGMAVETGREERGPYGRAGEKIRKRGWRAFPVDIESYGAPPRRVTGRAGCDPSTAQCRRWARNHPDANVGVAMPDDVLAIDVDYKTHQDGAAEKVVDGGPKWLEMSKHLPPTWSNGHGDKGSIYRHHLYRVPEGVTRDDVAALGDFGPGVDLIRWSHRWLRVAPSIHKSGEAYFWLDASRECAQGPHPEDLTQLTAGQWAYLQEAAGVGSKAHYNPVDVDVEAWLGGPGAGEPSQSMRAQVKASWATDSSSHHDRMTRALQLAAHLGEEGEEGAAVMMEWIREQFCEWREGPEGPKEVDRALAGAVGKAAGKTAVGGRGGSVLLDDRGEPLTIRRHLSVAAPIEPFPRLDLAALVDPARPLRRWLLDEVVPEGDHVSIVAPGGTGKSLLVLALAVEAVRGAGEFLGREVRLPAERKVLYVDMENSEDDWAERLRHLGVNLGNVSALNRLICLCLPALGGLDTASGAKDLLMILDNYEIGKGDVLVLDSTQRVTAGPENDADTFRNLYNFTSAALKRRGITVIRTDNTGKDSSLGARGSSGKRDDVGYSWTLVAEKATDTFSLSNSKRRSSGESERLRFERKTVDGVLRFVPIGSGAANSREVEFKTAASRVLRSSHDSNETQATDDAMSQAALLRAVKDEGVQFKNTTGHAWLAELVKEGRATVTETRNGGATTKNYRWLSDYVEPSIYEALEEVPGGDGEAC